ncbi:hypothetical protein V6615_07130 [Oscillospiraceae bacterium PP1C4]
MKKLLIVMLSAMLLLSFTACGTGSVDAQHVQKIESELEELKQENTVLSEKNADLQKQVDDLQAARKAPSGQVTDAQKQAVLDDLPSHTDLIPIKAELGGTLRYFPEQSKVLTPNIVYAYAEDGHVSVEMLLEYVVNHDHSITWSLAAYDIGNGWVANS